MLGLVRDGASHPQRGDLPGDDRDESTARACHWLAAAPYTEASLSGIHRDCLSAPEGGKAVNQPSVLRLTRPGRRLDMPGR